MIRAATWFILGGLTVACLAGPIAGALSGLFWDRIGGGHTESAAVARINAAIYARNHIEGDYPTGNKGFKDGDCEQRMSKNLFDPNTGRMNKSVLNLYYAILKESATTKIAIGNQAARQAVIRLSYPALGALEGCIGRSLLASLCEAYVQHITQVARQNASATIVTQEAENDRDWQEVWCTAIRALSAHQ